jgi:hypothetical protein
MGIEKEVLAAIAAEEEEEEEAARGGGKRAATGKGALKKALLGRARGGDDAKSKLLQQYEASEAREVRTH